MAGILDEIPRPEDPCLRWGRVASHNRQRRVEMSVASDEKSTFDILKDRVVERVSEHFPVRGAKQSLLLDKVWVDDNLSPSDIEGQLQAKNNDDTWGVPVRGTLRLVDNKSGQVISKQTVQLAKLPKMTSRYSFIIDGGEYQVDHLLRLKSGVYTRIATNGDMRSEFNLRKGGNRNFSIELDRNTKQLDFKRKGTAAHIPVYPLMKVLGVSDDEMEHRWGKEIFAANRVQNEKAFEQALVKFWQRTNEDPKASPPPLEKLKEHVYDYFEHADLYPDITKVTLGQPFEKANGKALLAASTKLLNVSRGTEVPDDRDSLVFKEVAHVEDFIPEFMKRKEKWIHNKIRQSLDSKQEVSQILQGGEIFKAPIIEFFTKGGNVSERGEQTNPLAMLSGHFKTTIVAPDFGGIKHPENLKDDMRAINPSHFGFLDPAHTPECHDERTEVFTRRGWVRWSEVTKDDLFLCQQDGQSFFAKAERIVAERYIGTMYGMDNGKISYLVTPNHRIWTSPLDNGAVYRFVTADLVHGRPRKFRVSHPPASTEELNEFLLPLVVGDTKTMNIPSVGMLPWAEFMGWFLSEGSASVTESGSYKVAISQSRAENPEKYERISALLTKLPFGEWGEEKDGRGFYLGKKQLAVYLKQFGFCQDKYIPEEIFSATIEAREAFIEAMLLGDGRLFSTRQPGSPFKSYKQKVFCTTSPRLAADFEKLATMMGYSASTKRYQDNREERYLDVYEVRLLKHTERAARPVAMLRASRGHSDFVRQYTTQQYDGVVYCATVPGGLLFTRRPGRLGLWTGNSERTGITLHLGTAVKKRGHDLITPVFNLKSKKTEYLNVPKFHEATVVLPDQMTWEKKTPKPVASVLRAKLPGGDIGTVSSKDALYVMPSTKGMFSATTNSIPFLPADQGNRASMADKQIEQAISLKHRDAPLVQTASSAKGTDTYERILGGVTATRSTVDGHVVEVGKDAIKVKSGRSTLSIPIYNHFPLNDPKGMLHSEPLVKVGDKVEKGQVIADSNFTKGGRLALGANLLVGYLPYRGYNFEDGIVISKSAAQKFTSEHLHTLPIEFEPEDKRNPVEWQAFNSKKMRDMTPEQLGMLDKEGVIKEGSRVKSGQVLVTALSPNYEEQDPNMVAAYKTRGMRLFKDKSLTWDEDAEGVVTRVVKSKSGRKVKVYVKTDEPAVVGDKITGRHGNKGIITAILPDEEMPFVVDPHSKERRPLQVLLNPLGVPTRMNVGQILETAAGKIAEKTGKPYVVDNFSSAHNDYRAQVQHELKQHGLHDEELVYDPKYPGRALGSVLVGPQYMLKLKHQVEKKLSVRGGGTDINNRPYGYTLDKQPEHGGARGGQGFGALESYSLLAHNARNNLREMATYKSDMQNEDFWDQIMRGAEPPPPRVPFSYEKFKNLLEGLGANVTKEGTSVRLTPMTDREVLKLAGNGKNEIKDGTRVLLARAAPALRPEKGGIFDIHATGGLSGTKWSFIRMSEPMPNPLFVGSEQQRGPVPALLGLRVEDIDAVMGGKKQIDGKVGGRAIYDALKKIDVDKELTETKAALTHKRGDALDRLNRKVKVLQMLKDEGLKPHEAFVLNYLPVIPPVFRPITRTRSTIAQSGLNNLYRNFANLNQSLGSLNEFVPDATKNEVRQRLWNGFKALQSVGKFDPIYDPDDHARKREMSGILYTIGPAKEQQPKEGYFQANLIKRRQDLSIRSTVVPEPALGLDQVGLPKNAAMELYKPFVVAKLRTEFGMEMPSALRSMQKSDPIAEKALAAVLKERPLLLKRDPALHKFSVMAFEPVITDGKAIKIHPLVTGGFNADFDGDCCLGDILLVSGDGTCYSSGQGELVMPHTGKLASYQVVDLSQFPRIPESKVVKPSGVIEYDVPAQVFVPAYAGGKMELRPVTKFSIHPGCEEWAVETKNGRTLTCSEDHSLALLDPETLEVRKAPARDAVGLCAPTMRHLDDPGLYSVLQGHRVDHKNGRQMQESVPLSFEIGWFVGVCIGDGWVSHRHVSLASGVKDDAVRSYWSKLASWVTNGSSVSDRHMPHSFDGKECESVKTVVSSTALSRFLEPLVGNGARSKHLPTRFLEMPEVFRRGLLAGLIDTDGSANWNSRGQFALQFTTTSARLAEEVMLLGLSLGLHSSKTEYENREAPAYVLSFSIRPVQDAHWLRVLSTNKRKALEELWGGEQIMHGRNDFVPLPEKAREELLNLLRQAGASLRPPRRNEVAFSQYVVLKKGEPTLTRQSARALNDLLREQGKSDYLSKWFSLVLDPTVGWDLVTKAEFTGRYLEMYDITVPDSWTFTMADGLVVWDTMAGTVPISQAAVQEARKLFPSKNLFSPTNYGVMYTPGHESILGLSQLSKWGKNTGLKVKDYETLRHLVEVGKVGHDDVVHVESVGSKPTTFGRLWMMHGVPRGFSMRDQVLHDPEFIVTKKPLGKMTERLAKEHPQEFDKAVNHLKDLGNEFAYRSGFSFGLKDFAPLPQRDRILAEAQRKAQQVTKNIRDPKKRDQAIIDIYKGATEEIEAAAKKLPETGNRLATMVYSGARGKPEQLRQMIAAPMLVQGHDGRTIPVPVTRSYAEGLDIGDYWITQHGARKGTLQRTRGTSKPGELTKDILNSTISTLVVSNDCGTHNGVAMPIKNHKDVDTKDVVDRFLAHDVKLKDGSVLKAGTVLTPTHIDKLRQVDDVVHVRSPLKCAHGNGICAKCYGLNENGKLHPVGTNIGVVAGQALGEPATQLAMDAFHCNHADSVVFVRRTGDPSHVAISMEALFDMVESAVVHHGEEETKDVNGWEIYDGTWVRLTHVRRHPPTRPMVLVSDGVSLTICQDNHPVMVWPNQVKCVSCGYYRLKKITAKRNKDDHRCPKCSTTQQTIASQLGGPGFLPPVEIEKGRFYLHRDLSPALSTDPVDPPPIDPYLAGAFVAEGCVRFYAQKNSNEKKPYAFSISQLDGPVKDKILSRLPSSWRPTVGSRDVVFHDLEMGQKLISWFGRHSKNKALPSSFLGFPRNWLADFIAGLLDGDGTVKRFEDGPDQIVIDTTSFELAQQVQMACLRLSIHTSIHTSKNVRLTRNQGYRVALRMTEQAVRTLSTSVKVSSSVRKFSNSTATPVEHRRVSSVKSVLYTHEYVYDATTETGTLYVSGLRSHNTGGLASGRGGASGSRIERLQNLLKMTDKVKGQATLAKVTGKVTSISPNKAIGGHDVVIEGHAHRVDELNPALKVGNMVQRGQSLSAEDAPVNPHQYLELTKDIHKVRNFLTKELYDGLYKSEGVRQRNVETVVRSLTNLTRVKDPGSSHWEYGDIAPYSEVEEHNRSLNGQKDKKPVVHEPVLYGSGEIPHLSQDWMSRLNYRNIRSTIQQAAATGAKADIHGTNPIPGVARGSEFGPYPKVPAGKKPYVY